MCPSAPAAHRILLSAAALCAAALLVCAVPKTLWAEQASLAGGTTDVTVDLDALERPAQADEDALARTGDSGAVPAVMGAAAGGALVSAGFLLPRERTR